MIIEKYIFISGIPASGKSYLAQKIAKDFEMMHVDVDDWREEMTKDINIKRWVNFFFDKDEKKYWQNTTCEKHWQNLVKQSEAFWEVIIRKINKIIEDDKSSLFEGVNILPHLAAKDLKFPGIFLLGESFETILERNKKNPRWSKVEFLQRKEAEIFFNCERPRYKSEAEKYGFKTFIDSVEAEKELIWLIKN